MVIYTLSNLSFFLQFSEFVTEADGLEKIFIKSLGIYQRFQQNVGV